MVKHQRSVQKEASAHHLAVSRLMKDDNRDKRGSICKWRLNMCAGNTQSITTERRQSTTGQVICACLFRFPKKKKSEILSSYCSILLMHHNSSETQIGLPSIFHKVPFVAFSIDMMSY